MIPTINVDEIVKKSSLEDACEFIAAKFDFRQHPYFLWMNRQASREQFLRSQLSFRFAVESFSCALAACLSRLPVLEVRGHVAENIWQEHGEGYTNKAHKNTFIQYLKALGASPQQLQQSCSVAVLAFNEAIRNYCLAHHGEIGAALLGMIEYLYIDISAQISQKISESDWAQEPQEHYKTHEQLDVEHARELFDVCAGYWDNGQRREVAFAMSLGALYFWNLYESLLSEGK